MSTSTASQMPGFFNATVPERSSSITISSSSITLGVGDARIITDVFIVDRGGTGDPVASQNFFALSYTPVASYPTAVYRNGIRQTELIDYTVTTGVNIITFPGKSFSAGETFLIDYLTIEAA